MVTASRVGGGGPRKI